MLRIPDPGSRGEAMLVEASGWAPSPHALPHALQCRSSQAGPTWLCPSAWGSFSPWVHFLSNPIVLIFSSY